MPVFDFSNSPEKTKVSECTYTVFRTNAPFTSPDQPILILDTKEKAFPHHPCGIFTNPSKRTSFEFKDEEESFIADILQIDASFVSLLKWLGENHINVRLSGTQTSDGYAVYKIRCQVSLFPLWVNSSSPFTFLMSFSSLSSCRFFSVPAFFSQLDTVI